MHEAIGIGFGVSIIFIGLLMAFEPSASNVNIQQNCAAEKVITTVNNITTEKTTTTCRSL